MIEDIILLPPQTLNTWLKIAERRNTDCTFYNAIAQQLIDKTKSANVNTQLQKCSKN